VGGGGGGGLARGGAEIAYVANIPRGLGSLLESRLRGGSLLESRLLNNK
jgi:hypothetical protein